MKGHYTSCCNKCFSCGSWGHRDNSSRFCSFKTQQPRSYSSRPQFNYNKSATSDNNAICDMEAPSASTVYDQLCNTSISECLGGHSEPMANPPLEHHIFNGQWLARNSEPHPTIKVTLTPSPVDHVILGHPMSDNCHPIPTSLTMIADSGCQSCVMPRSVAHRMGLLSVDTFPVRLTMRGASGEDLQICGGIVANISTNDISGSKRCTKQIIYLSDKMTSSFLSREALVDLGVLPTDFPAIPAQPMHTTASFTSSTGSDASTCSCPKKTG